MALDVSNEIKCFLLASHKSVLFICALVGAGGLKVLQHGSTGSSSFTNNEPSCPSDVDAVHSLNRSEPPEDASVWHREKANVYLSVHAFPLPCVLNLHLSATTWLRSSKSRCNFKPKTFRSHSTNVAQLVTQRAPQRNLPIGNFC